MNRKKDGACVRNVADVWRVACAMCNVRATMCATVVCYNSCVTRTVRTDCQDTPRKKEREKIKMLKQ